MAKWLNIFFLFLFLVSILLPQPQDIKFGHISVEQGLSNNFVHAIAQDSSGFMWFATEDGLNKYDGYTFTVYRHEPGNPNSLSENKIYVLAVDKGGIIWIGTDGGGLNSLNPITEEFIRYNLNPEDSFYNGKEFIYDMYIDKSGTLWLSVQGNGLYKYEPDTKNFIHYVHDPHQSNSLSSNYGLKISSTVLNGREILWVSSWGGGLNKFDRDNNEWVHYRHDPGDAGSLPENYIVSTYADNHGFLWISTGNQGLSKMDLKTERFTNYRNNPANPNSLSGKNVGEVWETEGILWIATMNGFNRFDIQKEAFTSYFHIPGDPNSISQNSTRPILESRDGLLWIGGWSGLDVIDFEQKQFSVYRQQPGNPNSLSDNFVLAILETKADDGGRVLWTGTKDGGLNKINRNTGQVTHYRYDPADPGSLSDNFVFSITRSLFQGKEVLWLATMDGLNRFDPQTDYFSKYYHDPGDITSIIENYIYKVYADRGGFIWIGTTNRGICRLDPATQKFNRYHHPAGEIWVIFEDSNGYLWHGSIRRGLIQLNQQTNAVKYYQHNPEDAGSISSNTIRSIHETVFNGKRVLWVGTNTGLNRFEYHTEKFVHYSRKDGLPSDEINGILEDKRGNLWLGTGYGLVKFNPETGAIRSFDQEDGLPGNQFIRGGYFQNDRGEMFFGSTDGLVSFFPQQITDNPYIPEIALTDFRIFNKSVAVQNGSVPGEDKYVLTQHIAALDEIELSYRHSVFSFEFAALDFRKPVKNRYAYKMEGVDPDWVYTDATRRFATYTNLDPGEYTFRVKGSNNDGIWNEAGTSITVIILPPWWKTTWAYTFYCFLFGFFVFVLWRVQTNRLKMKHQMEMQNFEAEKLREVDKLKSRFFANISHEFRTPLTLIKGPVKQIMDGTFSGNLKQQYLMILRNSDRLLGLINQILDLSKLEAGEMKLTVSETNMTKYLKGLVFSFASLAETKKISLKWNTPDNNIIGYADRDKLEKIVTNLLSNAFKFTPEQGVIKVDIEPPASPNGKGGMEHIQMIVSNTGAGIPADRLDKIFDRFYQANDSYKKDSEGSGIGLALTKELVEKCHGKISVSSIPDKSTTFVVLLPISRNSFKEEEIITETATDSSMAEAAPRIPGDEEHERVSSESARQSPAARPASPLLLIVEDNPDVTAYICSFMENDYRIITGENGREGLEKALDKYPDLIISDVMMPEMDGFELCRQLKLDQRISHIPVILLTAKADLDSKINGLEFGADDYITKPFEARELQIRAKNLIAQRRKLREKFALLMDIKPEDIAASSMDEQLLKRLLMVFEDHMEEPGFSIEQLAREIGMSRQHLNRKIQAITNISTSGFIRTLRLQKAAALLKNASGSVSEIAYQVGFNNLSYFSKAFRRHFGKRPSEFSKK